MPGPRCLHTLSQCNGRPRRNQLYQHNLGNYTHTTSQTPGKMGRFDVKNSEKAPSDGNKRGKGFGIGNTIWREAFAGTSEALNMLQVKFDHGEGNEGGRFSEYL